ncbi:hypothetical protein DAT35_00020 [Vitiosangium sp. GDMCC 1.1324]|nr:hypothetical protein DAT35_00020 [Vitiosangium sp. GDMCC 1.1324]
MGAHVLRTSAEAFQHTVRLRLRDRIRERREPSPFVVLVRRLLMPRYKPTQTEASRTDTRERLRK